MSKLHVCWVYLDKPQRLDSVSYTIRRHIFLTNSSASSSRMTLISSSSFPGSVRCWILLQMKSCSVASSSPMYSMIFLLIQGLMRFFMRFSSSWSQSTLYANSSSRSVGIDSTSFLTARFLSSEFIPQINRKTLKVCENHQISTLIHYFTKIN